MPWGARGHPQAPALSGRCLQGSWVVEGLPSSLWYRAAPSPLPHLSVSMPVNRLPITYVSTSLFSVDQVFSYLPVSIHPSPPNQLPNIAWSIHPSSSIFCRKKAEHSPLPCPTQGRLHLHVWLPPTRPLQAPRGHCRPRAGRPSARLPLEPSPDPLLSVFPSACVHFLSLDLTRSWGLMSPGKTAELQGGAREGWEEWGVRVQEGP